MVLIGDKEDLFSDLGNKECFKYKNLQKSL